MSLLISLVVFCFEESQKPKYIIVTNTHTNTNPSSSTKKTKIDRFSGKATGKIYISQHIYTSIYGKPFIRTSSFDECIYSHLFHNFSTQQPQSVNVFSFIGFNCEPSMNSDLFPSFFFYIQLHGTRTDCALCPLYKLGCRIIIWLSIYM